MEIKQEAKIKLSQKQLQIAITIFEAAIPIIPFEMKADFFKQLNELYKKYYKAIKNNNKIITTFNIEIVKFLYHKLPPDAAAFIRFIFFAPSILKN